MMKEYYNRKKQESVNAMTDLLGFPVDDTRNGMINALALALKDGTAREVALAIRAAVVWFWADVETDEEGYKALASGVADECDKMSGEHVEHADHEEHSEHAEKHDGSDGKDSDKPAETKAEAPAASAAKA